MKIPINTVVCSDRIRQEMGDIDELSNSIREFGLIQPIILTGQSTGIFGHILVAGARRLEAMKRAGITELEHGKHFILRDEQGKDAKLRYKAIELEENVRRKGLTWQEELDAKRDLFDLMVSIYGVAKAGGSKYRYGAQVDLSESGFGVKKLASMLGESLGKTSQDLKLARAMKQVPMLKKADTKGSAMRQLNIIGAVASMAASAIAKGENGNGLEEKLWILHEGEFSKNVGQVADSSVDLVYTDLPFGVDLSKMSKHTGGVVSYSDSRENVVEGLERIAVQSYRILRPDRYALYWFGFNYYHELLSALQAAGFTVNPVPIVWYKHTRSTENPNTRYANAFDPAIVAMKGSPVFIRPGQTNVIDIPAITPGQKLQIAQQPVELVKRFIGDMTAEGATVVDLMCGSGTTGVAAVEMKRRVILFERSPIAVEVTRRRLEAL